MTFPPLRQTEIFKFFSSLKLAVISILSLAAVLSVATVLESLYGMRAAHVMVYGTYWFYGVLALLGLNVLCAALSRYPWKRHQTGFVVTHLGILVILFGSWLTQRFGVDGNLPVIESSQESRVILNALHLSIFDESNNTQQAFPVPETALREQGDLLKIGFGNKKLVVKEFLPRVRAIKRLQPSPLPDVGVPGIEMELASSRFGEIDQILLANKPDAWTEVSLGPAKIAFRKLWTQDEEQAFVKGASGSMPETGKAKGPGEIVVSYHGQQFQVPVGKAMSKWTRVASTSLEVLVERYLPYAIVENNQLVSKSEQPVNPAIQLKLRNPVGTEEKHTVFANFPEFDTLHGRNGKKPADRLGAKLRFIASTNSPEMAFVGSRQGILAIAQSVDGKKLLFRSMGASGDLKTSGELSVDKVTPIGWMDTSVRIRRWYPAAIETTEPVYVEKVAGTSGNFLSALRMELEGSEIDFAGENWILEGDTRAIVSDGKRYRVRFDREQLALPFSLHLNKFTVAMDPGTEKAAGYSSDVEVRTPAGTAAETAHISMNEPLKYGGYTFYQASYQLRDGEPPISVFSVNLDPGRWVKYLGSILLCLGIGLMFYMNPHYWNKLLGGKKE
jgi:hypothetical protein